MNAHTLTSDFDADDRAVSISLTAGEQIEAGFRLALTSVVQLTPGPESGGVAVAQLATYHEFAPGHSSPLAAGDTWTITELTTGHRPNHANDGPVGAFVIHADHSTSPITVVPMTRTPSDATASSGTRRRADADHAPLATHALLVPFPRDVEIPSGTVADGPGRNDVSAGALPEPAAAAWAATRDLTARLLGRTIGCDGGPALTAVIDDRFGDEQYRIEITPDAVHVTAAGRLGFRHAFVTVARWLPSGLPMRATVEDHPTHAWRGLHIDLARRWYEPEIVSRLIDECAWRKLAQLHLHLTDDEAWRVPVAGYPQLTEIGGTRGHGLPLGPMLGDDAGPTGRAYTREEIADWVTRADELGITLVPEVDVPAHVHAALTALPHLRDADDTSGARSVQFFIDNVLVPGHPANDEFLTAVFESIAELFPRSPWIHIGGDEVAEGAWTGSPIVARTHPDAGSTRELEASFHRGLINMVRTRTGRSIGAWQEAAESGGVHPDDGYVVGWRTPEASRELAAAGYDVVVSPGQAYYLDMALDTDWDAPGATWAGTTDLETVCAFEPDAGWSEAERARLIGVQACLWSEHVDSLETLEYLLFPRLDAIAERAWTGQIVGGAASLRGRASTLPLMTDTPSDQHRAPVVVATFPDRGEAEVSLARLRGAGIEGFIVDEVEGGAIPVETEAGVTVLVHAEDADTATQLLAD